MAKKKFKKDINFDTNVALINSISLEHEVTKQGDHLIAGKFIINGDYKMTDTSVNLDDFEYELPFNINIDKKYKIAGAIIGGLFAAVYLAFLILPHLIDINKFMPMISDEVQKISGFKISVNKPKLSTTLRLGAKIKAETCQVEHKRRVPAHGPDHRQFKMRKR